jgi:hypothetical protein
MPGEKASSGDRAGRKLRSARAFNRAQAAADYYEKQLALGQGINPARSPIPTDCLWVHNDCGADRLRGDVLEITGIPTTTPTPEHIWVTGDTPTAPGNAFCILRQATPDGDIDVGQVSGVCLARVNVGNASHTHAKLAVSAYELASAMAGPARIIYKPSGTGIKECIVKIDDTFGGYVGYLGYGDTITARSGTTPGSGTVTLYKRDPGTGLLTSLGVTVTVYNTSLQTPSSSEIYIQLKVDPFGDFWWDVDDCTT